MNSPLELLLEKINIIKFRQLNKHDDFNLFRILRHETDEVHLHSRFLYELLNPAGSHNMGDTFLKLFIHQCNLPPPDYSKIQVYKEKANIDLLIQDPTKSFVIENKIYASDQPNQLERYCSYIKQSQREPYLLYLTLHGHEPSSHSIGNAGKYLQLISYKNEIQKWLHTCIKEAATKPLLRESLLQYINLIKYLTGDTMNEQNKQQILSLIAQGDNAENAFVLVKNWGHIRWHAEWDFWNDFQGLIEKSYQISEQNKFSSESIDRTVHGKRNRNPWYGLSFMIGTLYGSPLHLRLERNEGPMYYGVPYNTHDATVRLRMRTAIQHSAADYSNSWAGLKPTEQNIDFESFSNSATLGLANPDKRAVIINNLYQEINAFIAEVNCLLQNEFGQDYIGF